MGQPLNAAIASVGRDMPAPIGPEFAGVSQEINYGMSLAESVDRLADRQQSQDLRFLAVAFSIQSQSGGNLVEVLSGLSSVIRARFDMYRKIRAATSEARWSGWFLSLFPVVMIFLLQVVRPNYFESVKDLPQFGIWTVVVFLMLVLNIVFMRMLLNIKV